MAFLFCLPAAAAYTLLGAHHGRSLRTGVCFAAEKGGVQGGKALQGPQGGGPAISARALDQLAKAGTDPEKKKQKLFKKGKKKSERKTEQKSAPSGKGFGVAQVTRFDRRPTALGVACGCGLAQTYETCCQPIHESCVATDPLALIRARYTAYAYRLPDFLIDTTAPDSEEWQADRAAWKKDLLTFCDTFICDGLEVGEAEADAAATLAGGADAVRVPFRAKLVQKGAIKMLDLIETSTLVRGEAGGWLYAKGDVSYEASPVLEGAAAEKDRKTDNEP